jgi:hypothetical protein
MRDRERNGGGAGTDRDAGRRADRCSDQERDIGSCDDCVHGLPKAGSTVASWDNTSLIVRRAAHLFGTTLTRRPKSAAFIPRLLAQPDFEHLPDGNA